MQLDKFQVGLTKEFLGNVIKKQGSSSIHPLTVILYLNGKPTEFEVDTRAEVTVISMIAQKEVGTSPLSSQQK